MNPFTKQFQSYMITPGQGVNIPQGWWHFEIATADNTHLLAIFDAPTPEVILGSDILKLTPANVMAHSYCIDENQWKKAVSPVKPNTLIGPPKDCNKKKENYTYQYPNYISHFSNQIYPTHAYPPQIQSYPQNP